MFKRILNLILVIMFIALLITVMIVSRNMMIFNRYTKKTAEYEQLTNFYAKYEDSYGTREIWRKDNVGLTKDVSENGTSIMYVTDTESWTISDTTGEDGTQTKTAEKSNISDDEVKAFLPSIDTTSLNIEEGFLGKLKAVFSIKISTEDINGILCYKFDLGQNNIIYVNTTDFMKIKGTEDGETTELKEYELNSVEDEDVKMPNLEGYEVYNL